MCSCCRVVACILCHFLAVPCVGQLSVNVAYPGQIHLFVLHLYPFTRAVLYDFINLTQVHNFTVSAQDIFTFRCISVSIVSFTGILQVLTNVDNETFCTVLLTSQVVLVESLQLKGKRVRVHGSSCFFVVGIFTFLFDSFTFIIIDIPRPLSNVL